MLAPRMVSREWVLCAVEVLLDTLGQQAAVTVLPQEVPSGIRGHLTLSSRVRKDPEAVLQMNYSHGGSVSSA